MVSHPCATCAALVFHLVLQTRTRYLFLEHSSGFVHKFWKLDVVFSLGQSFTWTTPSAPEIPGPWTQRESPAWCSLSFLGLPATPLPGPLNFSCPVHIFVSGRLQIHVHFLTHQKAWRSAAQDSDSRVLSSSWAHRGRNLRASEL